MDMLFCKPLKHVMQIFLELDSEIKLAVRQYYLWNMFSLAMPLPILRK